MPAKILISFVELCVQFELLLPAVASGELLPLSYPAFCVAAAEPFSLLLFLQFAVKVARIKSKIVLPQ